MADRRLLPFALRGYGDNIPRYTEDESRNSVNPTPSEKAIDNEFVVLVWMAHTLLYFISLAEPSSLAVSPPTIALRASCGSLATEGRVFAALVAVLSCFS